MGVIASELMNVQDADREGLSQQPQAVIESISLDAEIFTHPVPAYQLLAEQGNDNAERMLNLVHTTQSMLRAKDAITALPSTAGDVDYETGGSEDFFEGEDAESGEELLNLGEKLALVQGQACHHRPSPRNVMNTISRPHSPNLSVKHTLLFNQ